MSVSKRFILAKMAKFDHYVQASHFLQAVKKIAVVVDAMKPDYRTTGLSKLGWIWA